MEKGGLGSALCFVCPLFEMFLITVENKHFIIIIIIINNINQINTFFKVSFSNVYENNGDKSL